MNKALSFALTVPAGPIPAAQTVIMNLTLVNTGDKKVFVNTRFAVVPQIGDVRPTIKTSEKEVPFPFRVRLASLDASDFLALEPGEAVVAGCNLSKTYRLKEAGKYQISATYVNETVPDPLKKEPVFVGEVTCEPVMLELV